MICCFILKELEIFPFVSWQRFIVYVNKGDHGFHNGHMDMKTIFRAFGPDFRRNFVSEPFDSIHIYPLMCRLLQIQPAPHNGSVTATQDLLLHSKPEETSDTKVDRQVLSQQ